MFLQNGKEKQIKVYQLKDKKKFTYPANSDLIFLYFWFKTYTSLHGKGRAEIWWLFIGAVILYFWRPIKIESPGQVVNFSFRSVQSLSKLYRFFQCNIIRTVLIRDFVRHSIVTLARKFLDTAYLLFILLVIHFILLWLTPFVRDLCASSSRKLAVWV